LPFAATAFPPSLPVPWPVGLLFRLHLALVSRFPPPDALSFRSQLLGISTARTRFLLLSALLFPLRLISLFLRRRGLRSPPREDRPFLLLTFLYCPLLYGAVLRFPPPLAAQLFCAHHACTVGMNSIRSPLGPPSQPFRWPREFCSFDFFFPSLPLTLLCASAMMLRVCPFLSCYDSVH